MLHINEVPDLDPEKRRQQLQPEARTVEYLKKGKNRKRKNIKGQPPCHSSWPKEPQFPHQHASNEDTLEEIDRHISEENDDRNS